MRFYPKSSQDDIVRNVRNLLLLPEIFLSSKCSVPYILRMTVLLLALKQIICVPKGNGVVIHLPGLFEEAEKNEKKGLYQLIFKLSLYWQPGCGVF